MRGPKPKPIEQKIREGNPGKRRLPAPVELPDTGIVKPRLPRAASWMWDQVAPILTEAAVLNPVDVAALKAMCMHWHRAEQARKTLAEEGIFSIGSMGQTIPHPALEIERQSHQMFLRFAEQFGITPVARTRIAAAVAGIKAVSMQEELERALAI